LNQVLPDEDHAIQSYRHALSVWIPRLTQVALITKKNELQAVPNFDPKKFRYILRRSEYEREWGTNYARPGFTARVLAVIVRILPKIGSLKALDIKTPNAQTDKMYVESVERTVAAYRGMLRHVDDPDFVLANRDLDTARPTSPAEYHLSDRSHAKLLSLLAMNNYAQVSPALRINMLDFYSDLDRPFETKRHKKDWSQVLRNLEALKKQAKSESEGAP